MAPAAHKTAEEIEAEKEQKKQIEALKKEKSLKKKEDKLLPRRKRAAHAERLYSFSSKAFYRDSWA